MQKIFRKEIKYVIPRENALTLQHRLGMVMEKDTHGKEGAYFIRSQYYDSIVDSDLRDNLEGMYEKRKIRLRIYSLSDQIVKLEYKCKNGSDGIKYSLPIKREEALRMEQGDIDFLLQYDNELALRLYLRMTEGCYRPKTIIDYDRLAFIYPAGDVRITFDTNIRTSIWPYGLFDENPINTLSNEEQMLMEVKYTGFLPDTIRKILDDTENLASAHSKYSRARMTI